LSQGLSKEEWDDYWKNKCETCEFFKATVFDSQIEDLAGFDGCYPIVVGQWDGYCLIKADLFPKRVKNTDSKCNIIKLKVSDIHKLLIKNAIWEIIDLLTCYGKCNFCGVSFPLRKLRQRRFEGGGICLNCENEIKLDDKGKWKLEKSKEYQLK
jgi:hypothetical protein